MAKSYIDIGMTILLGDFAKPNANHTNHMIISGELWTDIELLYLRMIVKKLKITFIKPLFNGGEAGIRTLDGGYTPITD